MNIQIWIGRMMAFIRSEQEAQDEKNRYFTLPQCSLPIGFSHADLGCGARKANTSLFGFPDRHADIGIDVVMEGTQADKLCALGLEDLPLKSDSQHLVTAYDVLEHIPKTCVVSSEGEKLRYIYPMIQLFNEIYRVLRPGGYFESVTPGIPNYWNGAVRDPTHVSLFCIESFDYFCGGRFERLSRSYGLCHSFDKVVVHWMSASHLQAVLQKPISRI